MSKKLTITLSDVAEKQFDEVKYSLDLPHKTTTNSDVISHCLMECLLFEEIAGDQITSYVMENYPVEYAKWVDKHGLRQHLK